MEIVEMTERGEERVSGVTFNVAINDGEPISKEARDGLIEMPGPVDRVDVKLVGEVRGS